MEKVDRIWSARPGISGNTEESLYKILDSNPFSSIIRLLLDHLSHPSGVGELIIRPKFQEPFGRCLQRDWLHAICEPEKIVPSRKRNLRIFALEKIGADLEQKKPRQSFWIFINPLNRNLIKVTRLSFYWGHFTILLMVCEIEITWARLSQKVRVKVINRKMYKLDLFNLTYFNLWTLQLINI